VAAFFGKDHKHVLRDITDLIADAPSIALNFEPIEIAVKVGFGTRMDPAFDMTKDGFTLLTMGFTGAKALQFKLAYIAAFNELEAKANAAVMALPLLPLPAPHRLPAGGAFPIST
jgi:Rha family phage regulatory protein